MKKRLPLIVFTTLLLGMVAVLVIYGLNRPILTVVTDPSWEKLIPSSELKSFRKSLSQHGIHLQCKVTDPAELTTENTKVLFKGDYILFSPVVSAAFESRGIEVKDLTNAITIAAEVNENYKCFDIVLPFKYFRVSDYCKEADCLPLEYSEMDLPYDLELDKGRCYVADYRFSLAVPSKSLKGVVCPDLSKSIIPLLDCKKGSRTKGELYYGFREIQ